jgi:hypothetical protein
MCACCDRFQSTGSESDGFFLKRPSRRQPAVEQNEILTGRHSNVHPEPSLQVLKLILTSNFKVVLILRVPIRHFDRLWGPQVRSQIGGELVDIR